ncbi:TetR/AcrR family transcriptional regulator [Extibacter muris]|uniref:TetR/AcrR family transcriptional regulator n=1 Tax=Extibacter muris TaxID=1796622 RepID=UPI00210D91F4|nr:TetR/AcrR family transcriptional regulator [Extibacter muris]MCQ4664340.1 TetR/AcrR family transcriptional regulator [Extibacter muris]MCQ4692322.1 TetR/AcrR family transcriptional regulator [Extibacter muris]MCQ4692433.1 TetR/AcrR family transcriptional regulator [Extibacter muris]
MGRRKKEPPNIHRENIALSAHKLFMSNGIECTTMNDIAKESGYSKATLYVYFQNKEEIIAFLVLKSMTKLDEYITLALENQKSTKGRYDMICQGLLEYQKQYPFYFAVALDEINIDFKNSNYLPEEEETYHVGEEINKKLQQFIQEGILANDLKPDIKILPTIMAFWGMLSGLIQISVKKEAYITQELKMSRQEFLKYGFETLYQSIAAEVRE